MKLKILIFFLCIFLANANKFSKQQQLRWLEWKAENSKPFLSGNKEKVRMDVFLRHAAEIDAHNAAYERGEVSFMKKLHKYSDITAEEFFKTHTGAILDEPITTYDNEADGVIDMVSLKANLPASVDHRKTGGVTPVEHQGDCGSCWAWAGCASAEYAYFVKHKKLLTCSKQDMIDCALNRDGCKGGKISEGLQYAVKVGVAEEKNYPYVNGTEFGTCRDDVNRPFKMVSHKVFKPKTDDILKAALTKGVVTGIVHVFGWYHYHKGILSNVTYYTANPKPPMGHGIAIVGYGTGKIGDESVPYWIIKNSWGPYIFGSAEKGFALLDARRIDDTLTYSGLMLSRSMNYVTM